MKAIRIGNKSCNIFPLFAVSLLKKKSQVLLYHNITFQPFDKKDFLMAKQTSTMKKSNISYSLNKITKSLAVPFLDSKYKFGSKMSDPIWKKAVIAKDFVPYCSDKLVKKSEVSLFRTDKHLVIGLFFHEAPSNLMMPTDDSDIWSGDMAEIHFGDMEPDPWLFQTGIGISGLRFDSTGNFDKWQAKPFITEKGWGAEVRFNLSLFRLIEGGLRFNICRQALKRKEFSVWSPLRIRFHEVENFGELLFTDYKTALEIKSGSVISGKVSRKEYELARAKEMIPAQKIVHGPYLSAPDKDSMMISWETAGKVPSYIEYREKGKNTKTVRAASGKQHAILTHNTLHSVVLTGLKPGKEYEYEIFTLTPVIDQPLASGIKRTFRMPETGKKNFSFYCITDIHSDVQYVRRALMENEAKEADFVALLGDNLSHAAGSEALFNGVIDPIEKATTVDGQNKPMVFVRGNHEQLGVYAKEYFNVMGHPSGKMYYSFTWGSVFFLILDSGSDSACEKDSLIFFNGDYRQEENAFLQEVVKSEAYQKAAYRIVMIHIPPSYAGDCVENKVYNMLEPLRSAKVKPDVLLSGHIHAYERLNPNETELAPESNSKSAREKRKCSKSPFHVIVHTNTAGLDCKVTDKELVLRILETLEGKETKLIDTIRIKKQK